MRTPTNAPPRHQGDKRATDTREDAASTSTVPACKPEIDLGSWSAFGKPSRDRRQKKAWHRQRGVIDVSLAVWAGILALVLLYGWLP